MKTSDQGNINWRNREMKLRDQEIIKEYLTYNRSKHNKSYIDGANFIINQLRNEINKKSFVPTICGSHLKRLLH